MPDGGRTAPAPPPQAQAGEASFPGQWTQAQAEQLIPGHIATQMRKILVELALRKVEGLNLYEPLPEQQKFHRCTTRQRLLRGSNRGGKTLPAAVEIARAVCGADPWNKYPKSEGRIYVVGKDLSHVGEVLWRKLGRPGAFKIIRDTQTNEWRGYRPWDPQDVARQHLAKKAPPLIPKRLVKAIAWENKAKGIPKKVTLHTGWEINFYSSESKPPQGSDIDLWWFDEEIVDEEWHPEMVARILDRGGRGIWSATPQAGTDKLFELHEIAEREAAEDALPRSVEEFVILLRDNPHIEEDQKKSFAEALSEEERQVRVEGEFILSSRRIFPEFSLGVHGVESFPIPADWTRYAVVDPGRQVCAVLFAAIPPPDEGDHCYLYDELYIPNCSAELFGQRMAQRCECQSFESFVIDHHGARITDIGSGLSVEEQYSKALAKYKVASESTGYGFLWGSDDVLGTVESVRSWLRIREDGTPKLRVMKGLPNFLWEMKRYRYKSVGGEITDKPEDRGKVHLMACLRYLAAFRPRYVRPGKSKKKVTGALAAFREKQKRQAQQQGEKPRVSLGPVGGLGARASGGGRWS